MKYDELPRYVGELLEKRFILNGNPIFLKGHIQRPEKLTIEERKEIADYMINLWKEWAE